MSSKKPVFSNISVTFYLIFLGVVSGEIGVVKDRVFHAFSQMFDGRNSIADGGGLPTRRYGSWKLLLKLGVFSRISQIFSSKFFGGSKIQNASLGTPFFCKTGTRSHEPAKEVGASFRLRSPTARQARRLLQRFMKN
jgi:hypothetical protein